MKSHLEEFLQQEWLLQGIPLLRDKNAFHVPVMTLLS